MGSVVSRDLLAFAVSGFLGQASDWLEVQKKLKPSIGVQGIDLFSRTSSDNLTFIDKILSEVRKHDSSLRKIFLGYSFGGRLGLKLLAQNPNLFERWVFVSTGAGLPETAVAERSQRLESDREWARKITPQNWSQFVIDWNAQSIFTHSKREPIRKLEDYNLSLLQKALVDESLAVQPDFRQLIKTNRNKILWITGRSDAKYLKQAEEMLASGCIEESLIVNGGHRLTYDASEELATVLNTYLL